MCMANPYKKLASKLLRLADVCPLCGNDQAENLQYHTKCPNMACSNYDVEYGFKTRALDQAFGSEPIKTIASGIYRVAYGEIARIVYQEDAKAALSVATKYQNDIPISGIKKLEQVVLLHGNSDMAYLFAKDVKEADVKLLEQRILSLGNIQTIYVFAKNIEGADIKAAEDAIISSGNKEYIRLFIQNVEGADIPRLEAALGL